MSSQARVREWHGGKLTRPRSQWAGRARGGTVRRSWFSSTSKAQNTAMLGMLNRLAYTRMKQGD